LVERANPSGRTGRWTDDPSAVRDRFPDFSNLLLGQEDEVAAKALRLAETTGRTPGSRAWTTHLENITGRQLHPRRRGPQPETK